MPRTDLSRFQPRDASTYTTTRRRRRRPCAGEGHLDSIATGSQKFLSSRRRYQQVSRSLEQLYISNHSLLLKATEISLSPNTIVGCSSRLLEPAGSRRKSSDGVAMAQPQPRREDQELRQAQQGDRSSRVRAQIFCESFCRKAPTVRQRGGQVSAARQRGGRGIFL